MKKTVIIAAATACAAALAVGGFAWAQSRPATVPVLAHEAGDPLPSPSMFLIKPDSDAAYSDASLDIDTSVIGEHSIDIITAKNTYTSVLSISDSVPPQATVKDRAAFCGTELLPEAFIEGTTDATPVTLRFLSAPDFNSPGKQPVKIVLSDAGGNETTVEAGLTLYELRPVTAEAGSDRWKLSPEDFVSGAVDGHELSFGTNLTTVNFHKVGSRTLKLKLDGSTADAELNIVDTTPPTAEPVEYSGWLGETPAPKDFVKNIKDRSPVTVSFLSEPDFEVPGIHDVIVVLTDEGGNSCEVATSMTIKVDTEPPVISGEINKRAFIGDTIAYRAGISVTDNKDGSCSLSIDSSAVDVYTEGVYTVYYSATDSSGNRRTVTGSVTVYSVLEGQVNEMADAILARITDDSMSLEQKARKIFDWIRGNVRYVNTGEKDQVLFGAYRAMQKHSGDCYTFYAISEVLLTRAGVQNIGVTRVGGNTRHYWQIVNVGNGWYHFDATPYSTPRNTFMFTESQAEEYTKQSSSRTNYYVYDKTLYPEVTP